MKLPPGQFVMPPRGLKLRGAYYTTVEGNKLVIRRWPKKQPIARTPREKAARDDIVLASKLTAYIESNEQMVSRELARRSHLAPRDLLTLSLFRRIGVVQHFNGDKVYSMAAIKDVSDLLDALGQSQGDILVRFDDGWYALNIGNPGQALVVSDDGVPEWGEGGGGGGGGWTPLPISTTSLGSWWNVDELYLCGEAIPVQPGDTLEVRLVSSRPDNREVSLYVTPDGAKCIANTIQGDDNFVLYRYAAANNSSTVLVGGSVPQDFAGTHVQTITMQFGATGQAHLAAARANENLSDPQAKTAVVSDTDFPVSGTSLVQVVAGFDTGSGVTLLGASFRLIGPEG